MTRAELANFLRTRREALQPEDVGLPRTRRRRAGGLRREEVAALSSMSTDYYSRIEQQRGPRPSEQMLAAIARALQLDPQQRDHLFHLAGYSAPQRIARADRVNPGMSAIFERVWDTPAVIFNQLGETLAQNPLATLLLGRPDRLHRPAPRPGLPVVHRPRRTRPFPRAGPCPARTDYRSPAARNPGP